MNPAEISTIILSVLTFILTIVEVRFS
ncbi:Protein of unknown function [Pyronema omphalodes CBS 100304]|uniref:Uncharacterized protein n=1 Tax=Pyronema omphalodes (strain CBS 100304) TaxID=1076935 RepID=U4LXN0_PYROM|nr:Protein of unknown function [Pyronema omphalodes CBS 100304]